MVARRVIDDHKDLENIGELSHEALDSHVKQTPFMVLSGSDVPPAGRYLEAGSGVSIVDNGPGSGVTISAEDFVFSQDLTVSLKNGRTFGRFASGEQIPATGKTPAEVILLAIAEPIDPTTTLTASNILTSAFNTTGFVATVLSGSYVINSAGASVSTVSLQFRIGGSGPWETLTNSTSNPLQYNHVFEAEPFLSSTISYRYTVVDTQSAGSTSSASIVPQAYAPPTMSLSIVRNTNGSITGETNTKRERGNIASTITGTITRQRINVPITNYSVQYSVDNSSWQDVPGLSNVTVAGNPSTVTIPSTVHNDAALVEESTIYYRIRTTDIFTSTNSSTTTVRFFDVIWYGPSGTAPVDSDGIRALSSKIFTDGSNPFTLNTGTTHRNFTVALPGALSITNVTDLDALNANITTSYVSSNMTVNNGGDQPKAYKVYTMTNAIAYSENHRHQVTRV